MVVKCYFFLCGPFPPLGFVRFNHRTGEYRVGHMDRLHLSM